MKNIERRIRRLEKQWLPKPETASDRRLLARLEAARRRIRELDGDSEPEEILLSETELYIPPGSDMITEMLNRGRQLRSLQAAATNPKPSEPADDSR